MRKDNREAGIVTIVGLLMFFILIIVFSAFSPILMNAISDAKVYITGTISTMLLDLIPAFVIIGIIISWFIYVETR